MNNKIKALNKKLSSFAGKASDIEIKLQHEYDKVFAKHKELNKAITGVERSTDYAWDNHGEIVSWIRFDVSDFEGCESYLKEYLRDSHDISLDFDNGILSYSLGTNIVINDDGDVYDQDGDKFFINKDDYRDDDGNLDESKRNKLIEEYMEKTGCYPGVFSSDRHGNIFSVNTKEA